MSAEEHLEKFLNALLVKDAKMADIKKFLTKTQQETSPLVKTYPVEPALHGLYSLLAQAVDLKIKTKLSTNPTVKDCIIKITGVDSVLKLQVRLVKEIECRKPSKNGEWGVNASSFKYLENKKLKTKK